MAAKRKRFENFTDEEIKQKRHATIPKATIKNNEQWNRTFRNYLEEINAHSTEYWYYPDEELDQVLSRFWFAVHTQRDPLNESEKKEAMKNNSDIHPEQYTIASLHNLRNGLSRCLSEHGKNIDLTTDPKFRESQRAFKDACKELKQIGKENVTSYPEITHAGKIYTHIFNKHHKNPKFQNIPIT